MAKQTFRMNLTFLSLFHAGHVGSLLIDPVTELQVTYVHFFSILHLKYVVQPSYFFGQIIDDGSIF